MPPERAGDPRPGVSDGHTRPPQTCTIILRYNQPMESLSPEVLRLFVAKENRRRTLAKLPFPDKVRAVVRLQRMVAPVLRARGRQVRVWTIEESAPPGE